MKRGTAPNTSKPPKPTRCRRSGRPSGVVASTARTSASMQRSSSMPSTIASTAAASSFEMPSRFPIRSAEPLRRKASCRSAARHRRRGSPQHRVERAGAAGGDDGRPPPATISLVIARLPDACRRGGLAPGGRCAPRTPADPPDLPLVGDRARHRRGDDVDTLGGAGAIAPVTRPLATSFITASAAICTASSRSIRSTRIVTSECRAARAGAGRPGCRPRPARRETARSRGSAAACPGRGSGPCDGGVDYRAG